jgi:phage FluMu protein Com
MVAMVQTMICRRCKKLVDVLIGRYGIEGPTGNALYDRHLGVCPRCRSINVVAWEEPRPCPKCGEPMIEGKTTAYWD